MNVNGIGAGYVAVGYETRKTERNATKEMEELEDSFYQAKGCRYEAVP
ncbi:MAG: hypothetical protein HFH58_18140 [Lachnospiraceae bacterium]|nr:hypothetical protein [Lachnospiraceae bacterium]